MQSLFDSDHAPAERARAAVDNRVVGVSELNRLARAAVERALPLMWVAGEVSNFTRAASGHCYFSLKDAQAQVRCVLFRHKAMLHDWQPQNGMQIEVRAVPSLYEARGEFQLGVEAMRRSGLGALYEAFEKLKAQLAAEGLFEAARKRPLPAHPRAVGIVTSLKAAALRDVLTTLRRRMPGVPVFIYPTAVQGAGAAAEIVQALAAAVTHAASDVLILCRGGGSMEDLWSFNDEALARAIAASVLPVISGVGHETDFTIADFVADARAPTPTAAAEMAGPDRADLARRVAQLGERAALSARRGLERRMQHLDMLAGRLQHPGERIAAQNEVLTHLAHRLRGAWRLGDEARLWKLREHAGRLAGGAPDLGALEHERQGLGRRLVLAARGAAQAREARLASVRAQLAQLDPRAVLERGYSLVHDAQGRVVRDAAALAAGDALELTFARGGARTTVTQVQPGAASGKK